jgi:SAM-dependent methyltransferase
LDGLIKRLALHVPALKRMYAELERLRDERLALVKQLTEALKAERESREAEHDAHLKETRRLLTENASTVARLVDQETKGQALGGEVHRLQIENEIHLDAIRSLSAEQSAMRMRLLRRQSADGPTSNGSVPPVEVGSVKDVGRYFSAPLVDLGATDARYAGVLCPEPELNRPKLGVSEVLLSGAEGYYRKFKNFKYVFGLIQAQLDRLTFAPQGIAVDFGSGFGNTVIPLLENFPDLHIIATDISPDLLAILLREAERRGVGERCVAVALDAQNDYFVEGFADAAFGGAVLHHLVEPERLLKTVVRVLKPGRHAIFLEPFEDGHSVLRLAYEEILRLAVTKEETGAVFDFLRGLVLDIAVRAHRRNYAGFAERWLELDDKWLFTRTYFEEIRFLIGAADVRIWPFNSPHQPFSHHTRQTLKDYAELQPEDLPNWAWDVLRRYDDDAFSPAMRDDLVIEGAVVITK